MTTLSTQILAGNPDQQKEFILPSVPPQKPTLSQMAERGHFFCRTCEKNFLEVDQRLTEVWIQACPHCKGRHIHWNAPVPQPEPQTLRMVCAWCQAEGKGPAKSPGQSHGICAAHRAKLLIDAGISEKEQKSLAA